MIALALAQSLVHQAPADLEAVAARLRRTGAAVQVSDAEDPAWEIWVDYNGPLQRDSLKMLRGVKRLAALRIFSEDLTDEHLRGVRDNPDLKLLVVMSSRLTDDCTIPISKMTSLRKLDLNKGTWSARGLARLKSLRKLERLYLYNAKIADSEFRPLASLKWIKLIDLPSNTSDSSLRSLRQSLPKAAINRIR